MGPLGAPGHIMAGGVRTGVPIANSCRFNDDDSAFTDWSPAGSGDDLTLCTLSFWVKRGNILGVQTSLLSAGDTSTNRDTVEFYTTDALRFVQTRSSVQVSDIRTDMLFRDPSAWYHIVVQYDSDQAASADRLTIWVNGVEVTYTVTNAVDSGRSIYWTNNEDKRISGYSWTGSGYFDGYLAEMHYCDGTAYTMADFGESNAQGHWIPKTPAVTYGTQGWHLDFAVAPGTGNGAGTDVSGNANHFTDSGLAADDQRTDTPTNNCATLNSIDGNVYASGSLTASQGNLKAKAFAAALWYGLGASTMWADSGKWYYEFNYDTYGTGTHFFGWAQFPAENDGSTFPGIDQYGWAVRGQGAAAALEWYHNNSGTTTTDTFTLAQDDVIGIAIDIDAGKIWFSVNDTWVDSGDPAAGTSPIITDTTIADHVGRPAMGLYNTHEATVRFNSDDITGTIPTGFKTFQVSSLTDATDAPIPKGSDFFDVVTYTGDSSNPRAITGLDFQPDLVWLKCRPQAEAHILVDSVRGAPKSLVCTTAAAELSAGSVQGKVSSLDSAGFTVDTGSTNHDEVNYTGYTYVAWCWKKAVKAGFDIQGYAGTGVQKQETHDLGVAPGVLVVKNRDQADNWVVLPMDTLGSSSIPLTDPETDFLNLNGTGALTDAATIWGDTAPDTVDFTVDTDHSTNASAENYVSYVWANIAGFSHQGSYVGNGAANGPFIWCGFRPRWVMIKSTTAIGSWIINDSARTTVNPSAAYLLPNSAGAEGSLVALDFTANGIKIRTTNSSYNTSADEYIYVAFAEHPFKYARAF